MCYQETCNLQEVRSQIIDILLYTGRFIFLLLLVSSDKNETSPDVADFKFIYYDERI